MPQTHSTEPPAPESKVARRAQLCVSNFLTGCRVTPRDGVDAARRAGDYFEPRVNDVAARFVLPNTVASGTFAVKSGTLDEFVAGYELH